MRGRHAQHGLSLVELMVALTVGLFLLGMASAVYLLTSQTSKASSLHAQMNEDATLALELLAHQVRLAGYSDFRAGADERSFQGQALMGCDGGFANANNSTNTANFEDLSCSASASGPDALTIRYQASALNSHEITLAGGARLPANCVHEGIEAWSPGPGLPNIPLAENRFFVAPDPANDAAPSLRCRGRSGSGFSNVGTLVPNIEDLQVLYALTRLPAEGEPLPHQVTAYREGGEVDAWSRVAGARLCVVARTAEPVPGLTPALASYVDCNGVRVDGPGDARLRRAYTVTLMGRNLRPALPAAYAAGQNPWRKEGDGG